MKQYHELLTKILETGADKGDRTGTGVRSIFGHQMRFDLSEGFPLVTTKKVHLKSIVHELLWILSGDTNIGYLNEHGVHIWDEWANMVGDLGPVYGHQWRKWSVSDGGSSYIDQISAVVETLKKDPDSRRMVVSAWNVGELHDMALAPCHCLFQFYTSPLSYANHDLVKLHGVDLRPSEVDAYVQEHGLATRKLHCQLYQRSADVFLGLPFNIASYALLTTMMAQVGNMAPGEFIWTGGDTHLYANHFEQARLQLTREPRPLPTMTLNKDVTDLFAFKFEDFTLSGYDAHPAIKAAVSV